jgi:tRNA-uridine 2-sulfurtransferase
MPGGGWLILGRDEIENQKIKGLCQEGDMMLLMEHRPGPTAILRRAASLSAEKLAGDLKLAASLVVRYGKKMTSGLGDAEVAVFFNGRKKVLVAEPYTDTTDLAI